MAILSDEELEELGQHFDSQVHPEALRKLLCKDNYLVIRAGKTTAFRLHQDIHRFLVYSRHIPLYPKPLPIEVATAAEIRRRTFQRMMALLSDELQWEAKDNGHIK